MVEFQIVWLDDEDLKLVDRIMSHVEGVTSREGALKWAMKKCALQFPAQPSVDPVVIASTKTAQAQTAPMPGGVKLQPSHPIPLGTHITFSVGDLFKGAGQFAHKIVISPDTFVRLVPNKGIRAKILDDLIGKV
jgi:hypothetical protein